MTINATAGIFRAAMKVAYCRVWAQRPFNVSSILLEKRSEHINEVIDEVGLDNWRFAGKLSAEWRKQSERNEGANGRQIGLRTTE
jgi:hypothetical protein